MRSNVVSVLGLQGDLYIYRLAGADLDNPATKFKIRAVPEVYKVFDDLSYEISKLKLKVRCGTMAVGMGHAG